MDVKAVLLRLKFLSTHFGGVIACTEAAQGALTWSQKQYSFHIQNPYPHSRQLRCAQGVPKLSLSAQNSHCIARVWSVM